MEKFKQKKKINMFQDITSCFQLSSWYFGIPLGILLRAYVYSVLASTCACACTLL